MPCSHVMLASLGRLQKECPKRPAVPRVDVATAMAPGALVGRQVRVLWPEDDAWFLGEVSTYDPATGQHRVSSLQPWIIQLCH